MKKALLAVLILSLAGAAPSFAQQAAYKADLSTLLSKIKSMGHGTYSEEEWADVIDELNAVSDRASRASDWNAVVESEVIRAMIYSDIRHDYMEALSILQRAKNRYGAYKVPAMKKVYVGEADVYSKLGDEQAVRRVMDEFSASPHFDAESYATSGGQGPNVPVKMVRPSVAGVGGDSVSVTRMNVARQASRFAPGNPFPDFNLNDIEGRMLTPEDFRGKVLLVDFWHPSWTPWKRDIQHLASVYSRYHDSGFEILGICLDPAMEDIAGFARNNRMSWHLVAQDLSLANSVGIYGECSNFLVDRNGVIVGRDLRGGDLVSALRRTLGAQ